jgi:predicted nuclease of predicted toxin-antitoxin system
MPRGFHKHKVLLDENMRLRTRFPRLNSRFDVKHIRDDFHHASLDDPGVYRLAVKEQRVLVTLNEKDFLPLVGTQEDRGIIGVSPHLTAEQIDTKLTALLVRSGPSRLARRFTSLTGEIEEGSQECFFSGEELV